jgi:hypothetical protein
MEALKQLQTTYTMNFGYMQMNHTPGVAASGSANALELCTSTPKAWPRVPFPGLFFQTSQ